MKRACLWRALATLSLLAAGLWPGAAGATIIGFEPPAYVPGPPPVPWTSPWAQITTVYPAQGAQCMGVGRDNSAHLDWAYLPVNQFSPSTPGSLAVELRPAAGQPDASAAVLLHLGGFQVQDAAAHTQALVSFEVNKPAGVAMAPQYRRIVFSGLNDDRTPIGYFLDGGYHDIRYQWDWAKKTVSVHIVRPDGVTYDYAAAFNGLALASVALGGTDVLAQWARYDNLAANEPLRHPGDANGDGKVSVGDLGILAANYSKDLAGLGIAAGQWWGMADFTGDGKVTVGDLGVLAANYGWTGAMPEPGTISLLGLGALALRRRV